MNETKSAKTRAPRRRQLADAGAAHAAAADFDIPNRLFFRLYQASNLLHKQGTRYVQDFGATTQQWAVLGALARPHVEAEGMTVKDLIEYLDVSRQNLAAVLDRIEERDWIERVVDANDARSRRIRLSASGRTTWRKMQTPIQAFYGASLKTFSPAEQAELYRLLDKLKSALAIV
jgi:DNA-binding MarR family transcriptional regulator